MTEQLFEHAANYYQANRLLSYHKTFAEYVVQTDKPGFFRDKATADWVLSLVCYDDQRRPYSQAAWIETKGFTVMRGKYTRRLTDGLHQYDQMIQDHMDSGAWGFYLVEWTVKGGEVPPFWTLHDVTKLDRRPKHIKFVAAEGQEVLSPWGWPEFYSAILELKSNTG